MLAHVYVCTSYCVCRTVCIVLCTSYTSISIYLHIYNHSHMHAHAYTHSCGICHTHTYTHTYTRTHTYDISHRINIVLCKPCIKVTANIDHIAVEKSSKWDGPCNCGISNIVFRSMYNSGILYYNTFSVGMRVCIGHCIIMVIIIIK